ncbi:MAG: PTS transporter subunit IIC [Bacilli bacterium]
MEDTVKQEENIINEQVNEQTEQINNEEPKREKKSKKILDFFITTLNGMAYGLFATLIIGTILGTLGTLFKSIGTTVFDYVGTAFSSVAYCLQVLTGAGIGAGIALSLKKDTLKTIVLASVGEIASYFSLTTKFVTDNFTADGMKIGDPLTIYIVVIITVLLMDLVLRKKTPVDILIVHLFGTVIAMIFSILIRYPAIYVTYGIQYIVDKATLAQPFFMGIIIAVVMGMALTAPISSAAIAAMIFTGTGPGLLLASGAAVVGCSTQMIGFAIQSRKDNNIGMVISIGIGTSMLQFKNILKKPIIWLPTIIASAILGPISTCVLKLGCMGSSAGMGTAGLVGQIGTISTMGVGAWQTWVGIFGLQIILPGVLVFFIDLLFRKFNLIKDGDFKV